MTNYVFFVQVGRGFSTNELLNYKGSMDTSVIFNAMIKGKATNTMKNYKGGFNTWKKYALENDLQVFPINKVEFSIFLITKCEIGASWSSLNSYICAAKCFHQLFCKDISNFIDFQVIHFLKKCSRKPNRKMRPLTKVEFDLIICKHLKMRNTLFLLRNICVLMFAYIAFLRYDDVSQIMWSNVNIVNDVVSVKLFDAKNDKWKSGQSVKFRLNDVLLSVLKNYIRKAQLYQFRKNENVFLFCDIVDDDCNHFKKLSYDNMREMLLGMCRVAGVDSHKIGTHSLRIGGCTEASRRGVPDYVIDYYGRWALNSTSRARYQRVVGEDAMVVSEFLNF